MSDYNFILNELQILLQELLPLLDEYNELNEAIIRFETSADKSLYDKEEIDLMYFDFQETYSEIMKIKSLLKKFM